MKWIGQHIWDLISRFRNDVYLEDVSSGTIASGGNLGLDSNNKIVKANVPAEHDAVTLTGTPDYITLSGQEITRNQIDLTADVTGVLPSANLDADTAHLSTTQTFTGAKTFNNGVYLENLEEVEQEFTIQVAVDGKLTKSTAPSERSRLQVRNDEGSTIPAGAPLYSRGEIGSSNRIKVGIADASDVNKMPCIGVAEFEMNTSDTKDSFAVTQGVYNTNISGFTGLSAGDILYVDDSGSSPYLTHDRGAIVGSANKIQNVGVVLRTNGTICQGLLVAAIGRTNDVPNLDEDTIFLGDSNNRATQVDVPMISVVKAADAAAARAVLEIKQISMTHHHFFMNSASTTAAFFFPYNNLNEASSTSVYYTRTIAPYAGKILKVIIRPSYAIGTACKLQFHKITNTDLNFGAAVEEVTNVNLNTAETSVSTAFSSATFAAGDVVNVSLIKSETDTANIQAVIVWEYTI